MAERNRVFQFLTSWQTLFLDNHRILKSSYHQEKGQWNHSLLINHWENVLLRWVIELTTTHVSSSSQHVFWLRSFTSWSKYNKQLFSLTDSKPHSLHSYTSLLSVLFFKMLCVKTQKLLCRVGSYRKLLITFIPRGKWSSLIIETCCDDELMRVAEKSVTCQSNIFQIYMTMLILEKIALAWDYFSNATVSSLQFYFSQ